MSENSASYNIAIVGGGPGGYVAAIRASQLGAKVALIERRHLGGTCLNVGCIPTKALLISAETLEVVRKAAEFGIKVAEPEIDFGAVMERKRKVIEQGVAGVTSLLKSNKVDVFNATAKVSKPGVVQLEGEGVPGEIAANNIIIATGSVPARPPIPGMELPGVLTSNEALSLETLPKSMVIIGGGYIGMEMAAVFQPMGTRIMVVEMLPGILMNTDEELARRYQQIVRQKGVEFNLNSTVKEIRQGGEGLEVVHSGADGEKVATGEVVLVAAGRVPVTDGIDVAALGLTMNKRAISVDETMRTNVPGIWAIGDATGIIQLAHVASYQGHIAVENIMGHQRMADYRAVPGVIFTNPEIASVGLTEAQAKERGIEVQVSKFPLAASGRAQTMGETVGLVKMICESATNQVLGVHIMGARATDLIAEATLIIQMEGLAEDLVATIHAHPTLPEVMHEAAMGQFEGPIHFYQRR